MILKVNTVYKTSTAYSEGKFLLKKITVIKPEDVKQRYNHILWCEYDEIYRKHGGYKIGDENILGWQTVYLLNTDCIRLDKIKPGSTIEILVTLTKGFIRDYKIKEIFK